MSDGRVEFFVSYARADQAWAEWVTTELEAAGRVVRMQAWDLQAGTDIAAWLGAQLAAARCMVTLLSESYAATGPWTREWSASFGLDHLVLVPLKVAPCDPPAAMRGLHMENLYGLAEDAAAALLLRAVGIEPVSRIAEGGFPGSATNDANRSATADRPVAPFPALPQIWNVPPRLRWFVGRDSALARMRAALRSDPGDVASRVVHGIGGVGKSRFAAEYAHRFAADYSLVWWVGAASAGAVAESFDALATELGLPADSDLAGRGRRALRALRHRPDWLLVMDNVEDSEELAGWWPSGRGHVLVTARGRAAGELGELVELDDLSAREAVALLRRRASHIGEADALSVVDELGRLPLAVDQAGAYLAIGRTDAATYLTLLRRGISRAMPGRVIDYPAGVCGSVVTSLNRLRVAEPTAFVLLTTAAYFAAEPLPLAVLAPLVSAGADAVDVVPCTHAIDRFALAQADGNTLRLHRFTQAVIRDRLEPEDAAAALARAGGLLATVRLGDPDDPVAWPGLAQLARHAETVFDQLTTRGARTGRSAPGHVIDGAQVTDTDAVSGGEDDVPAGLRSVLLTVGWYLDVTGQLRDGSRLSGRLLARWREALGPDAPDTLRAARLHAATLRHSGERTPALALDQDTLARWRRLAADRLGGERLTERWSPQGGLADPSRLPAADLRESLLAADAVATGLRDAGQRTAARDLRRAAFDAATEAWGANDALALRLAGALAFDLYGLDDIESAYELDLRALRGRRALLGDDHPDTMASAFGCARDLRALDRTEEARDLHADGYERARRVLGDDHPETLRHGKTLAVDLYQLGDYAAARTLHTVIHRQSASALGEAHPFTLRVANDLGLDLLRLGETASALREHEDAYRRAADVLGGDHADTLHIAHNLARDLAALGRTDEAVALLRDTLTRRTRVLGAAHSETRRTARKLDDLITEHG